MKIAIIAPEFIPALGGAGVYAKNLIKELSKDKSLDIHVITPLRDKNADLKDFKRIKIHYITNANDTFFYNFKFQLGVLKKFEKLHKKYNFDLVHSTGLVHMPDIFIDYSKLNVPHVVTVHTTIETQFDYKKNLDFLNFSPVELFSRITYPYIKFMQKKYIKKTKYFICVSGYVKNFIPKEKEARVINNGIEFMTNSKKYTDFSYFKKIKKPKVLYCGRLLHMKGLNTLIGCANLQKKVHFVIAGEGNIKKWKKLAKSNNVTFLGKVNHDKIHSLYSACNIFVLPSFSESFPISILEAMSAGLPIVAGNVGGIPEIIGHKRNGLLFSPGNLKELNQIISELRNNKGMRDYLGKNAKKDAIKKYSSRIMAKKTVKFYKDILGDKNF